MVRALRQYGRWLRDNYADLEHKEIWRSFIVLAIILLAFTINEFCDKAPVYEYAMLVVTATLTCYLLWRVETLSDLSIQKISGPEKTSQPKDLTSLLQHHCPACQSYRDQPFLSQPVFLRPGHHLQYLYQQPAHQSFHETLS